MIDVRFPHAPHELLLLGNLGLAWILAGYGLFVSDPETHKFAQSPRLLRLWNHVVVRSIVTFGALLIVGAGALGNWWTGFALMAAALLNVIAPGVRARMRKRYLVPEIELLILLAGIGLLAAAACIPVGSASPVLIRLEMSPNRLVALLWTIGVFIYSRQGGTILVRGFLDKAGAPMVKLAEGEARRGRIIGNLERWLLGAVVAAGHFDALGFLTAAKGFIRSKKLEEEHFAEYFLIGTLVSVTIVVVGGLVVGWLWARAS